MKKQKPATVQEGQGLSALMEQGNLLAANCPSRTILKHVTSRWGVLVLIALQGGTYRFSDLRRKIGGVSERMLAQTLQWLENDGFVIRKAYPVVPPHVEYKLSPLGIEAAEKVRELADWIEVNFPRIAENWGNSTSPAGNQTMNEMGHGKL